MSAIADAIANHSLTSANRPRMPTFEDEQRAIHQATRLGILLDEWDEVESEWLEEHIGAERATVWGIPDTSANPLADLSRQLSTPGLYGIRPDFRRTQGNGEDLVGVNGHMERAGFFTRQQFVQYLTLGLGDMFVRFGTNRRQELTVRLVWPHNVYIQAPADDPSSPTQLWEMRRFYLPKQKEWVFAWEIWDLGEVSADGSTIVRPPSYSIWEAESGTADVRDASTSRISTRGKPGGVGRDLSHLLIERNDGTFGRLDGEFYPWTKSDGTPVFPHTHYKDSDTGMLWNTFLKRGAHKGTLNTGLFWTYAGHCARDATGSYVIIAGLEEGSHTVMGAASGANRNPVDGSPSVKTKLISPGAMEYHSVRDGETPFVHEVGPGANLEMVVDFADRYEMKQAVRWGLNPTDLARTAANPSSAAALMVGNQGKRDFSSMVTPIFRRKDLESIMRAAIVLRAAGVARFPEDGYSTQYFQIPRSPQEEKEQRDQLEWEREKGQLSEIELYRKLHPGTTDADAFAALVKIAADNARLEALIARELAKLDVETPEPDPDSLDEDGDEDGGDAETETPEEED